MADTAAGTIDAAELIGSTLAGRYQIESQLGKGGMAVVYKATDKSFGRQVAIKVLRTDVAKDPVAAKRLVREARAAGQLHHPNIITMHDVGESGGMVYIVMEILRGQELSDLMEEEGAVDVARALEIGRQVASALVVAHGNGIIHRDIKPENLFLIDRGSSDFVKMLDFSIAKLPTNMVTAALTRAGSVFGTPHYMAPEQVEGRQVCPQTDIYALGAVIYELIAGEPPFDGNSVIDILLQHAKAAPPKLADAGIALPPGLSELIDSMLAKKETDRPANAGAVEEALARMIDAAKRGDVGGEPAFAAPTVQSASAAATEIIGKNDVAQIDAAARAKEPRYRPTHLPPDYGPPESPAPKGALSAEDRAKIRKSEIDKKRKKDAAGSPPPGMHGPGSAASAQSQAAPDLDLDLPSDLPEAMDRGGGMRAPFKQPEPNPAEATLIGAGLAAKVRAEAERIEREKKAQPAAAPAGNKPRRAPRSPQRQTGTPSAKVKVNVPPPPGGRARLPSVKAPGAMRQSGAKRSKGPSWDNRSRSASSTRHEAPAPPTEQIDASKIPTSPGISKDEVERQHRASSQMAAARPDIETMRGAPPQAAAGNQKTMLIAAIAIAVVGLASLAVAAFLFLNK